MNNLRQHINLKYIDKTYWALFIMLIVVACVALFSASSTLVYESQSALGPVAGQMFFFFIGIVAAFFIQFVPSMWVRASGYLILGFSLLCLYAIMVAPNAAFVATINGASRWIKVAGITFQPSEIAKLGLIIVVADQLARVRSEEDKKKYFIRTLIITVLTVLPIMVGNLSTAVLLFLIVFIMWILARLPWKYILSVFGIGIVALVLGYCIVEFAYVRPHRQLHGPMSRAVTWVGRVDDMFSEHSNKDSKFEVTDENYQRAIAKVAIARGSKSPLGVLPGNSKERDFLPLAFADYIFAIIVEESGIIGACFLIFLYMSILFRACWTSSRFADYSSMLMVMGLALMITCQALISMMVAVGIGPVTGQPLPIITRGGTSAVITSIYFGIIMGVSREQKELQARLDITKEESNNDVPDIILEDNL